MEEAVREIPSQWEARRYIVQKGIIRPVPDSDRATYDPADGRDGTPLHLALVALDETNERDIEDFASRWGLLGLAYHHLFEIQYGDRHAFLAPQLAFQSWPEDTIAGLEEFEQHGAAKAIYRNRDRFLFSEDLRDYAAPYLTRLDRSVTAALLTPDRWNYLVEPLADFQRAVAQFKDTFHECLAWTTTGQVNDRETSILDRFQIHTENVLELPRREVTPGVVLPKGRGGIWARQWLFPSLLAGAYAFLKFDLLANRNLRFCGNTKCRKPFIGDRSDQQFCSLRCLKAQTQRLGRQKARETG